MKAIVAPCAAKALGSGSADSKFHDHSEFAIDGLQLILVTKFKNKNKQVLFNLVLWLNFENNF